MRHQSAFTLETNNTGNAARPLCSSRGNTARLQHTRQNRLHGMDSSLHGVDYSVLQPLQKFTPQLLLKFELWVLNTRSTGRGGGLAAIHRHDLELSSTPLPALSSCECLTFKLKAPFSLTVLLMYRPPKSNSAFISEISDLLTTLCTYSANIIILGDLNIHINALSCHHAAEFLQILEFLNRKQHVDVTTPSKGHTLDLVISNSVPISNLADYDLCVSDHKVVSMELPLLSPHAKPKRHIQFRNLKKIDAEALALDLQLLSSVPTDFLPVARSVDYYNKSLSNLLDLHAPLTSRKVSFSRSAPWYTCKLRNMKATGLVLEWNHRKSYVRALSNARSRFYSLILYNTSSNSEQLFSTVNYLLKPPPASHCEVTEEKCNMHIDFFRKKVNNIRSHLSATSAVFPKTVDPPSGNVNPLRSFTDATQGAVEDVIKKMRPTTCALDPFPSTLLQANISAISPLITKIINQSFLASHIPSVLKSAVIRPLLKKTTLAPETLSNYRPISNLPKIVATQLYDHIKNNNLFDKFQSGFRPGHGTEIALVRVTNDLLMAADSGSPSLLILLDLTAAFDAVDHTILLHRLQHTIGLTDNALKWFTSYLSDRTEYVTLGKKVSLTHKVTCGVPLGSVLDPTLFNFYLLPLGRVISKHGLSYHSYADDTQLYRQKISTSTTPLPAYALTILLEEIEAWMRHNFLQLNSSKTEAIRVGTPHQLRSSTIASITFSGQNILFSARVTNLGVKIDPQLTFDTHIKHLCSTAFHHLRNIAKLRPSLSLEDAEKLVHAFVSSRLDYCNALLIGISGRSIQRLQYIQNSAVRILMRVRKHNHITPILKSLHWLPVLFRIQYKVILLTHQCIHGQAPQYPKELLIPRTSSRTLRSASANTLQAPRTKLCTMGDWAFSSAAPRLWNSLPDHLRASQNIDVFQQNCLYFLYCLCLCSTLRFLKCKLHYKLNVLLLLFTEAYCIHLANKKNNLFFSVIISVFRANFFPPCFPC